MKLLRLLFIFTVGIVLYAADNPEHSFIYGRYLYLDLGSGYGSYRDYGTSPLLYEGVAATFSTGYLGELPQRTWEIRMNTNYIGGFIEQGHIQQQFSEDLQLSYMHTLPLINGLNMNLKAGARLSTTFSGAYNSAFENASFNLDVFSNIMARMQYTYAFIIPEKQKKKRTRPETHHAFICNLELPLLMFNARPEFSYVMDGNNITLDRHIFFGGYSIQTNLAFRSFLPNNNAFEISYVWKMYLTGKRDIYKMEKASHILQLSYFFKLDQ